MNEHECHEGGARVLVGENSWTLDSGAHPFSFSNLSISPEAQGLSQGFISSLTFPGLPRGTRFAVVKTVGGL